MELLVVNNFLLTNVAGSPELLTSEPNQFLYNHQNGTLWKQSPWRPKLGVRATTFKRTMNMIKYDFTAEQLQMDLFAPPPKHQLCTALELYQKKYNEIIESGSARLCKSWRIAKKNANGVYAEFWHLAIIANKGYKLELAMALRGNDVVAELDMESQTDNGYGRYTPLSDISPLIVFSILEDIDHVEAKITTAVNAKIVEDMNLSDNSKEKLLKMVPQLIERATNDIIN